MKRPVIALVAACFVTTVALAAAAADAQAPAQAEQKCRLHGGQVSTSKQHCFESVFDPQGVRVFLYTPDGNPTPVGKARGTVRFEFKDGSTTEVPLMPEKPKDGEPAIYYCSMHPEVVQKEPGNCPKCGMSLITQYSLSARADLDKGRQGGLKAVITLLGLPGEDPSVTFTENAAVTRDGAPATSRSGKPGTKQPPGGNTRR